MRDKKITVIVPIYNAEKYINKCVDSLLEQTYKNLEIILINDGSSDNSLEIIKKYEQENPKNIKVFSHKNHGLSYTRNVGLKNATGDYITFLDSDDWFDRDYVEILLNNIKDNDIVISGFKRFNYEYKFQYEKKPKNCSFSKYKFCSIAGKMFSSEFIKKCNLKFKKVRMGEDSYFNISAYSQTDKVAVADYAGYCNYENLKSMTNDVVYSDDKLFYSILKSIVSENDISKLEIDEFLFYVLKTLIVDIFLYKNCLSSNELIIIYERSISWYKDLLKENGKKFKIHIQKGEEFKINLLVNIFIILTKLGLYKILIKMIKKAKVSMI